MAPAAALPNSRASNGPDTRKPLPMIEANGVTVARHAGRRVKGATVKMRVTMMATARAARTRGFNAGSVRNAQRAAQPPTREAPPRVRR